MPIVSGVIAYDTTYKYTYPNAVPAGRITNVPVILQDTSTGVGLVVLTDATGAFVFNNVPAGSYNLVEGWGTSGGVASPGNFATAVVIPAPTPQDPPITQAPSPPPKATRLQSYTRNTIPLTVTTVDLTAQSFVDSPIIETPVSLIESSIIGGNLISDAQTGEWGTLPAGAVNMSIPPTAPYPGVVPSETYNATPSAVGLNGATYNATNFEYSTTYSFQSSWWSMANHTTFDETSRMMVINAAGGGPASNERIFSTTISVSPNSYYVGMAWIANLISFATGYVIPQIGVRVSDASGNIVFNSPTPQLIYSSPPEWVQIGGVFNSGNNTSLKIDYLSIASGANGNDFVADDFAVYGLQLNSFVDSTKVVNTDIAKIGDVLTYTIVLSNTGTTTALSVLFQDTIPTGTNFVPSSVSVNGTNQPSFNPSTGFTTGNLSVGGLTTISFNVTVASIPPAGLAINNSTALYSYSPVSGGVTVVEGALSNAVQTNIVDTTIVKSVNKNYANLSDTISYTLAYQNLSNFTANNVVLIDTIPTGANFVNGSLKVNGSPISGNPNPPGVSLPSVGPNSVATITYDIIAPSSLSQSPVNNIANIQGVFTDTLGITVTVPKNSNIVTTTLVSVIISSNKIVSKSYANVGDILTYTIAITNSGNTTANNILFIDTIPNGTQYVANSLKQDNTLVSGSSNPPGVTLPNGIGANKTSTVTFQVQVLTIPNPNPIPNTATSSYTYTVDPLLPNSQSGNTSTNIVNTQINTAQLGGITKSLDKLFVTCGDTITYTINVPNTGDVTANNVVLVDTVPNGTTFVANSILVNGVASGATSPSNIPLGSINPGATTTVSFKVVVQC